MDLSIAPYKILKLRYDELENLFKSLPSGKCSGSDCPCLKYLQKYDVCIYYHPELLAAEYGHLHCIKYLISRYNFSEYYFFSDAIKYNYMECIKYFADKKSCFSGQKYSDSLQRDIAKQDNPDILEYLTQSGYLCNQDQNKKIREAENYVINKTHTHEIILSRILQKPKLDTQSINKCTYTTLQKPTASIRQILGDEYKKPQKTFGDNDHLYKSKQHHGHTRQFKQKAQSNRTFYKDTRHCQRSNR